jgi:hypothetical protein
VAREVERIVTRVLQDRGQLGHVEIGATEFVIREAMHRVGGVLLERLLNSDQGGHRGPRLACRCGAQAQFIDYRDKHVLTVLGGVRVRRAYYHCAVCRGSTIPKDEALEIAGSSFSPGVRRLMARVGSQEPFDAARQDLVELAGIEVKTKEVERVSEACGDQIEHADALERRALNAGKVVPLPVAGRLYIAIDGTGVPVVPRERAGRVGKGHDGVAKTREAKLGCVFRQSGVDARGFPVREHGSTSYVGAIETAAEFGPRIAAEALRRGLNRTTEVVVLGDGAPWIWNLATERFPGAVHVVDLYHAREHLAEIGRLVYAHDGAKAKAWTDERREELDAGDVAVVVRALRRLRPRAPAVQDAVRKAIEYFAANAHRMCYGTFRRQGFFVGSGVIEAGCKTVIGQRLKQSGMRWTVRGANAIIALRCSLLSNRWAEHWHQRAVA